MEDKVLYVGLDVDDAAFHGAAVHDNGQEAGTFRCRPTIKGLTRQLEKLLHRHTGSSLRVCYEATYIGFSLQRALTAAE